MYWFDGSSRMQIGTGPDGKVPAEKGEPPISVNCPVLRMLKAVIALAGLVGFVFGPAFEMYRRTPLESTTRSLGLVTVGSFCTVPLVTVCRIPPLPRV